MIIDFYLRFHTKFGQQLSIVGNISALGENIIEDALPMKFFSNDFWHASIDINEKDFSHLHYQYILKDGLEIKKEAEKSRIISFKKTGFNNIILIDTWNDSCVYENVFFTTPFQKVLFPGKKNVRQKKVTSPTHAFKIKAPLLGLNEIVCLLGSPKALQSWNVQNPLMLEQQGEWWVAKTDLSKTEFPIRYKYGIYDIKKGQFVRYEENEDRVLHNLTQDSYTILHDGFLRVINTWKGAGVAIPVFSLRTKNSFGVGEFADIKLLVDWAVQSGLKLLQFLPVNDTSATFSFKDSYP